MIAIPESLAFYWSEPANRAAINVLAGKTEVPPDLTLDEVERFEVESLASERVRLDLWRTLRALWSTSFGEAVRAALPPARLLSFGEHASVIVASDFTPSVARAWSDGETYGVHEVPSHGHLVTCVYLDPATADRAVILEFYFLSTDGRLEISDGLDLGSEWSTRDGWRATQPCSLAVSEDGTTIDPAPLGLLGRSAMNALAEALMNRETSRSPPVTERSSKVRAS